MYDYRLISLGCLIINGVSKPGAPHLIDFDQNCLTYNN